MGTHPIFESDFDCLTDWTIADMIQHYIPNLEHLLRDYGCTGVGFMDSKLKSIGRPIDLIDEALLSRKQCIQCAIERYRQQYSGYLYVHANRECGDLMWTARRSFCECDIAFIEAIRFQYHNAGGVVGAYNETELISDAAHYGHNFDKRYCKKMRQRDVVGKCCEAGPGLFVFYNHRQDQCCWGNVVPKGSC